MTIIQVPAGWQNMVILLKNLGELEVGAIRESPLQNWGRSLLW